MGAMARTRRKVREDFKIGAVPIVRETGAVGGGTERDRATVSYTEIRFARASRPVLGGPSRCR